MRQTILISDHDSGIIRMGQHQQIIIIYLSYNNSTPLSELVKKCNNQVFVSSGRLLSSRRKATTVTQNFGISYVFPKHPQVKQTTIYHLYYSTRGRGSRISYSQIWDC
ncbi:hypothetical protein CsSME_00049654 [Camellia sinensis var. sinensis]